MHSSFSDQLAGLDLSGFSIGPAPVSTNDFPVHEAVVQTLEAVWSDLFAMVSGTALEADAEDRGRVATTTRGPPPEWVPARVVGFRQ